MSFIQLARLRRDAVNRGVFPESVSPQVTDGGSKSPVDSEHPPRSDHMSRVASCSDARLHVGDTLQVQNSPTAMEVALVKRDAYAQPTLHQRPRYIYGGAYAPTYQGPSKVDTRPKNKETTKRRVSLNNTGGKCKNCAEDAGWPCIRLEPSLTGVRIAREVLIGRAFNGRPGRRFRKTSFQHKKSPLRKSFSSDRNYPRLELSGIGATNDPESLRSTSSDTLVDMEEKLMALVGNAGFSRDGDNGLLSPDFARRNVSCIFDDVQKPLLLSTVCPSLGSGAGSGEDSELPLSLDNLPEIEDEWEQPGDSQSTWPGRRVTFAEPPPIQRDELVKHRAVKHGSLLNRATKAGLKRLSSLRFESLGKKSRRID